ncbi:MAG: DUF1553 domain-containing protein [Acidobacteriota bacterium]|nr:DUF1553 domain-containing protein [Acidobacteriota bacterium]
MVTIPRFGLPGVTSLSLASVLLLLVVPARGHSPQSPPASDTNPLVALTLETGRPGSTDSDGVVWLRGSEARQQLLVTGRLRDGRLLDYTRKVRYESGPPGIVSIDNPGCGPPLPPGSGRAPAWAARGRGAGPRLSVGDIGQSRRVNFPNEIVPIFTKSGCNSGGCHGKASGQNGFRLSLFGFEPQEDFEFLVIEGRGRRLFPAAPERSLLLLKATGSVPHGGGLRVERNSPAYDLLSRWIRQGMPYGEPNDAGVVGIQVLPAHRLMARNQEQQLLVTATYSDGSSKDVTRLCQYESNQKELAEVSSSGLVRVGEQAGQSAVMVRFQDQVSVFRVTVPYGGRLTEGPPPESFIDRWVLSKLRTLELPPSEPCDDATFLRRTSIDITGRLPTPGQARKFLEDPDPAKRGKWVDELLASPEYADYFANKWSAILRNKRRDERSTRGNFLFHAWIRQSLLENKPYDRWMKEIVTASGELGRNPAVTWFREVKNMEDQVQDAAQIFLGVRLQCARCHHHPYERWSQQDYYGFAAFFSRMARKPGTQAGEEVIFHDGGTAAAINPKTKLPVMPTGLGTSAFDISPEQDPRAVLADWMADKDNPFFARMLVNRYWKHFMGRGLVEPEDDMRGTNPATNPDLLDALAGHFVQGGFDLKELIRTICRSGTYQRSSHPNDQNADDSQNFSRYYPKRLTAEVLLDAIDQVTDVQSEFPGQPSGTRAVQLPDDSFNADSYFLTLFGRPNNASASESERTHDANLAQSLHLLNSPKIHEKVSDPRGRAARLANDSGLTDEERIRELYLWTLSRLPEEPEMELALGYIRKRTQGSDAAAASRSRLEEAYQDTLWALVNTKEFLFNH